VAHGELLQMFKMPPVKVEALLTVGKNCVTCSPRYLLGCVLGLLVLYSTLNPSGSPMSRSQMELGKCHRYSALPVHPIHCLGKLSFGNVGVLCHVDSNFLIFI
jgi:hypothetical protein